MATMVWQWFIQHPSPKMVLPDEKCINYEIMNWLDITTSHFAAPIITFVAFVSLHLTPPALTLAGLYWTPVTTSYKQYDFLICDTLYIISAVDENTAGHLFRLNLYIECDLPFPCHSMCRFVECLIPSTQICQIFETCPSKNFRE